MDTESTPITPTKDDRLWAMICHLSAFLCHWIPFGNIIAPLVIWIIKKDTSAFIDDQGKEALNAQISFSIYLLVVGGAAFILSFILIGFLLVPIVALIYIAAIVLVIVAAVKAYDGERYRYPFILRFFN